MIKLLSKCFFVLLLSLAAQQDAFCGSIDFPKHAHHRPTPAPTQQLQPFGQIEIQSVKVPNYMNFKQTPLNKVVHVSVSYQCQIGEGRLHHYKDIWYQACQPIGSEQRVTLELSEGKPVAINVKLNSGFSEEEVEAAANASIRLFMETAVKGALVSYVAVNDDAYRPFVAALARDHFVPYYGGIPQTGIILAVRSASGKAEYLEFRPPY